MRVRDLKRALRDFGDDQYVIISGNGIGDAPNAYNHIASVTDDDGEVLLEIGEYV